VLIKTQDHIVPLTKGIEAALQVDVEAGFTFA
jgi:hypothetical protein